MTGYDEVQDDLGVLDQEIWDLEDDELSIEEAAFLEGYMDSETNDFNVGTDNYGDIDWQDP